MGDSMVVRGSILDLDWSWFDLNWAWNAKTKCESVIHNVYAMTHSDLLYNIPMVV